MGFVKDNISNDWKFRESLSLTGKMVQIKLLQNDFEQNSKSNWSEVTFSTYMQTLRILLENAVFEEILTARQKS